MTHAALARTYRPRRFGDLIGQEHVALGLAGAVERNRVAHAYLLTGPRGVGKTTAARVLAMALNCERRASSGGGEPCGECESCRRIWLGAANLDVVEIDAASNRGVDDARELRERAMYAASGPTRHKVYIIDEAHMLTREAWNALLKILEEPPPRVIFVFATTEPQKIANTAAPVLSRVQRFDFRRISPQRIAERLRQVAAQENVSVTDDAIRLIARVASGGMRDALSLLDQALVFGEGAVSAESVREALGLIPDDLYAEFLDIIAERDPKRVLPFVARLADAGADLPEFVVGVGDALRAVAASVLGGTPPDSTDALRQAIDRHAAAFQPGDALRMLKIVADAEAAIRRSANARLQVETLLLQLAMLDRTVELSEVWGALSGGGGGSPATPREPARRADAGPPPLRPSGAVPARPPGAGPTAPGGRGAVAAPAPAPAPVVATDYVSHPAVARWPEVLEAVGRRRRVLKEALSHAVPTLGQDGEVILMLQPGTGHVDGVERGRGLIAEALAEVLGRPTSVVVREGTAPVAPTAPEPVRRTREADQDERLRAMRAKDPVLDSLADALDLELLE